MRRALAIASLGTVLGLIVAGPVAAQQRDPFDPLIQPQETVAPETTGDGTTDQDQTTDGDGVGEDVTGAEELPNTGADPDVWLVAAYVLIALGLATVVIARAFGPASFSGIFQSSSLSARGR
jgi:hypothetical protein